MTSAFPLPVMPLIFAVRRNAALTARAEGRMAGAILGLFAEHPKELSLSSAGRCALELYHDLRGEHDIPTDPWTQLTRFDTGHLMGVWEACLFAEGVAALYPGVTCILEPEVRFEDVPGHLDVDVRDSEGRSLWVIDFKWTYFSETPIAPDVKPVKRDGSLGDDHLYQVLQVGSYAAARKAPWFSVVTVAPGVWRGEKSNQADYETWTWEAEVAEEVARMKAVAAASEPPEQDARESWRHKTCDFGECPLNKNPNRGRVDPEADALDAALAAALVAA